MSAGTGGSGGPDINSPCFPKPEPSPPPQWQTHDSPKPQEVVKVDWKYVPFWYKCLLVSVIFSPWVYFYVLSKPEPPKVRRFDNVAERLEYYHSALKSSPVDSVEFIEASIFLGEDLVTAKPILEHRLALIETRIAQYPSVETVQARSNYNSIAQRLTDIGFPARVEREKLVSLLATIEAPNEIYFKSLHHRIREENLKLQTPWFWSTATPNGR